MSVNEQFHAEQVSTVASQAPLAGAGPAVWQPQLALQQIHPLVLILLGGTGRLIAEYLKYLLHRSPAASSQRVQLVVFDVTDERRRLHFSEPLAPGELHLLEAGDLGYLLDHLDEEPYIKEWFPDLVQFPELREYRNLADGGGTQRVLTRLLAFREGKPIVDHIRRLLDAARGAAGGGEEAQPDLVFAGSLGGAVCSGLVQDLAALCRASDALRFDKAYLIATLASLYAQHPNYDRIQANCYQALRELDHFHDEGRFQVRYSETQPVSLHGLFERIFLVDKDNQSGASLSNEEEAARMIAEFLFHFAVHNQRDAQEQVLVNSQQVFSTKKNHHRCSYSAFGVSKLVFDLEAMTALATEVALQGGIRQALELTQEQPADGESLLTQHQLKREELLLRIYDLDDLPERRAAEVLGSDRKLETLKLYVEDDFESLRQALEARVHDLVAELKKELVPQVQAWLTNPERGIPYVEESLSRFAAAVEEERLRLVPSKQEVQLETLQEEIKERLAELEDQAATRLGRAGKAVNTPWWTKRFKRLVKLINERNQLKVDQIRQEKALAHLQAVKDLLARIKQDYPQAARGKLQAILERLEQSIAERAEAIEPSAGHEQRILTSKENIQSFCRASFGDPAPLAKKILAQLTHWLKQDSEQALIGLRRELPPAQTANFHFLEALDHETVDRLLAQQFSRARPFVTLVSPQGIKQVTILSGYAPEELDLRARMAGNATNVQQLAILGKNELVVIRTLWGFAAPTLGERLRSYQQVYQTLSQEHPIALMPEAREFAPLFPQPDRSEAAEALPSDRQAEPVGDGVAARAV
ncbi:MAG TPA: hypothetical protein ENI60_00875 [Candidatus Fraserbacteria bacterium]|nr:hypothetical protein [Candidatus Fraserbacteria bacterium]